MVIFMACTHISAYPELICINNPRSVKIIYSTLNEPWIAAQFYFGVPLHILIQLFMQHALVKIFLSNHTKNGHYCSHKALSTKHLRNNITFAQAEN